MKIQVVPLAVAMMSGAVTRAEDKGMCPSPPPLSSIAIPQRTPAPPSTPDKTYAGTVTLLAVVTSKGFVCNAQVIRGIDKRTDAEAVSALRKWHFNAARKDGRPVPALIAIDVNFRVDRDGKLVHSDPSTTSNESVATKP